NVTVTPPATPGTYNYNVNSATGNPMCPSSTVATATIIVDDCGCGVTAGNNGPFCNGTNLTANLTATDLVGATYSWTGPSGFVSNDQNPIGVTIPSVAGTYDFTVEADVSGTICTSVTTVTVYDLPTVDAGTYGPF